MASDADDPEEHVEAAARAGAGEPQSSTTMRTPVQRVVDDGHEEQHVVDEHGRVGEPLADVVVAELADGDEVRQHEVDHDGDDDDDRGDALAQPGPHPATAAIECLGSHRSAPA